MGADEDGAVLRREVSGLSGTYRENGRNIRESPNDSGVVEAKELRDP